MNWEPSATEHPLAERPIWQGIRAQTSIPARSPMGAAGPYRARGFPAPSMQMHDGVTSKLTLAQLSALESALTKNRPITLLQSILTKTLDLKSPRINTYKKTGGRGSAKPTRAQRPRQGEPAR